MLDFDDRTAGQIMRGVAAAGVIVALVGAVVGWSLVGRIDATAGDTLELTAQALATIEDTIVVADDVVSSTVEALEAVELTLSELVTAAEATQPLLESLGELGTDIAPNLESATATLRSLEDVGNTIDRALDAVGDLPFAPRYNPSAPLGQQFGRLADDIEPLADTIRETSDRIGPTVDSTAELQERIANLEEAVGTVRDDLQRSEALLTDYASTAKDARVVTDHTLGGVSRDVAAARVLVLLAAAVFAAGQIVPYWFGRELVSRAAAAERVGLAKRHLD